MEKNRLLLNHKKYLSFSNYKNLLYHSKKAQNESKLKLYINMPPINLIVQNNSQKNFVKKNSNNATQLLNNRNSKIFNNNLSEKVFVFNKLIHRIKQHKYYINDINNENKPNNKLIKFKFAKTKDKKIEQIKESFKDDNKKYKNKVLDNCCEKKNIMNKTNFFYKYKLNNSVCGRCDSFYIVDNKEEKSPIKLIEQQNIVLSTRKINKDSFRNDVCEIIKEDKGRKKIKYKIIGRLKTEQNCN
jgi:hypothetical protein